MNYLVELKSAVKYNTRRTQSNNISIENFVTTDNVLQNKAGITLATNLPPQGSSMPGFEKNNILVANIRPYLKKIWFADRDGGCSADVLVFEVNKKYDPKYIYYSMFRDDFFDHVMRGSKGTKMPRGDKNQILDFLIPDFDISKQQQIASVLSSLDSKIGLNNCINAELEAMAKTLYDYWFVQFDFPNSKGTPYKSSGGKMVWNEELKREVPEGWNVKRLKEFADTGSGGTPLSTKNEFYENGDIPWINSGEVNEPFIVNARKFITQKGLENSSAKLFKKGTILMAMYGATAGKVSIMDIEASTNQAVCGINPHQDIYKTYVKLGLEDLYRYLVNLSSGSARDNLSQDKIKELQFIIPDENVLKSFDKIAHSAMNKILSNMKENIQLSSLRDWLLPMLMNGQVKVS